MMPARAAPCNRPLLDSVAWRPDARGMTRIVGTAARGAAISAHVATHLRSVSPRRLRQFVGRIGLATRCVRDVAAGQYPHIPWKTVGALTAALAYFLVPVDALPDIIPLTGFLDDAAVLGLVFGTAERDLRRYCAWRGVDPHPYYD
mgnify:CR=1 FL=1